MSTAHVSPTSPNQRGSDAFDEVTRRPPSKRGWRERDPNHHDETLR